MRFVVPFAAVACLAAGAPVLAQTTTADQPPRIEESAPPAPETETLPTETSRQRGSFDVSALSSLLGQLLSQGPQRGPGATQNQGQVTQEPPPPPPPETPRSSAPSATYVAPPSAPVYSRRDALHARIYARRMALINRIRGSAEASGNEQLAGQADQLEALVTKVHTEGLGGIVQMLGQLQAARQSQDSAPSTPPATVPDVEFGEAAPLPTDDAPSREAPPSIDPPKPQPNGGPELPPALPLP